MIFQIKYIAAVAQEKQTLKSTNFSFLEILF